MLALLRFLELMMLHSPARSSKTARRPARGFTLIELLVVIGIIVLLAGIAIPLVLRAQRAAKAGRIAGDFQAISTALEAFKQDHGSYPEVQGPNLGAALLGRSLMGPFGDGYLAGSTSTTPDDTNDPPTYANTSEYLPGDCVQQGNIQYACIAANNADIPKPPTDPVYWVPLGAANAGGATDGADGPGIRPNGGKKYGPYLADNVVKMRGLAIVDINGNPVLYFPASPAKAIITATANYLPAVVATPPANANFNGTRFDPFDNWAAFRHSVDLANDQPAQYRIHAMFGDYSCNGGIDTAINEVAYDRPFILWSAGVDGFFGPTSITDGTGTGAASNFEKNRAQVNKCDDVTNFQ